MKIGIISDIHSNYDALLAVIKEFEKEKVDKYICLGDIIGFGKYPDKCVQLIIDKKEKFLSIVKGNHEKYLLGIPKTVHNIKNGRKLNEDEYLNHKYNHSKLSHNQKDFLNELKEVDCVQINNYKIFVSHYPKYDVFYKYSTLDNCIEMFDGFEANVYLFGHTHIEKYYQLNNKYFINPGPVGCPVIINSASCGILEVTDHIEYKHKYVTYDVDKTINELYEENIPANDRFLNIFYGKESRVLNINYKDNIIKGFLEIPNTFKNKYPLVIMVHGFNGSYKSGVNPFSKIFANEGIMSYNFDFINGSIDSISGGNLYNISLEDEYNQLVEVCKVLTNLENVDKDNIYIFGRSQGGLLSSMLVSKHIFDIKKLILFYPAFNIIDTTCEKFISIEDCKDDIIFDQLINKQYFKDAYSLDIDNVLKNININTLIFHGKDDKLVNVNYSNYASNKIQKCKYYVFENEGHGFSDSIKLKASKIIIDFIKEN